MGRLDDISERNKRGYRPRKRRAEPEPRPTNDPELPPGKRLEHIAERNANRGWPRERTIVMLMLGLALLLILSLMLFTDLGVRKSSVPDPAPSERVHDIQLRRAPTRSLPTPPAAPPTK